MSEQQNRQMYEDEIDLKELFLVLWKGKIVIIACGLIFALLTALFTMFFIAPTYEAKMEIIASFPETISTKYGTYKLPMTTNDQYVNLIKSNDVLVKTLNDLHKEYDETAISAFTKKITIAKDEKTPNSFTVTVKAGSPTEALDIANLLYENYMETLNKTVKVYCAKYYITNHTNQFEADVEKLEANKELLSKNKALLDKTPQTINQKDALSIANINSVDYVVLENIINPNYTSIESKIIAIEQETFNLENSSALSEKYISELEDIKTQLLEGSENSMDLFPEITNSIYLPSQPLAPNQKTSPSTALNTVIGGVVGGMVSVIYVLIRKYWFDDKKYDVSTK